MELGTFGAVMKFALELESSTLTFYEEAITKLSEDDLNAIFETLKESCSKRIKTLERIRRENVTEMILEPITGLNNDEYSLELGIDTSATNETLCQSAIKLEEMRRRFYEKGSVKIDFLIEAATAFDRLASENQDNIDVLRMNL